MKTKKQIILRGLFFIIGTVILNFGAVMVVQADFGASSSVALPYALSLVLDLPLPYMVSTVCILEVVAQFFIRKKKQWQNILQIPWVILLSGLMDLFLRIDFGCELLWERLALMVGGIVLIALGVFLSVNMRVLPAPPEGLLDALTQRTGKNMGLVKNLQDFTLVGTALLIDLVFRRRADAVGLATAASMILVGRIVALCSKLFLKKLLTATGLCPVSEENASVR